MEDDLGRRFIVKKLDGSYFVNEEGIEDKVFDELNEVFACIVVKVGRDIVD